MTRGHGVDSPLKPVLLSADLERVSLLGDIARSHLISCVMDR